MPSPPSAAPAKDAVVLERGQTIDRFVVLGLVGRGGMGEVYAAYDPELDRKVALKLLRARGDAVDGGARLLREAQAIAKLSHPNVVVVYDVGTFGESVFIAMEFVEGRTLAAWMQAGQRSRREILDVFVAAGRGLAAAHAAGLVHRDFKPDNVMVTNDGQVRVMDFGLARQTGRGDAADAPPPRRARGAPSGAADDTLDPDLDPEATLDVHRPTGPIETTSGKYLSLKITQTGALLGTPAYMAPEQFAMAATDARTDQFSFCVALYELLHGERPFAGETFMALMTSVSTGEIRAAPAKARVPAWLRKVVVRGLATDPGARHPSMTALLAALTTDPTVRTKRLLAGVAVVACVALAAFGVRRATGRQQALCRGGGPRWAGVWEPGRAPSARKDAIHRAFAAVGGSRAEPTFAGVAAVLDDYVGRWVAMYADACEATHVRGEQSAEVLDLRMSCLQERLVGASALSDLLSRADAATVENARAAASGLPRLERCADVPSLKALVKPPDDEPTRVRVESLRKELARMTAERWAGHCTEAQRLADGLLPRVRAAGYQPLLADALFEAGMLVNLCSDPGPAEARLREGFTTALAARYDEGAAADAIILGGVLADREGRFDESHQWLAFGRAELRRFDNHPLLDVWLVNSEEVLAYVEGRSAEAVALARQNLAAKERLLGPDHPDTVWALSALAAALELSRLHADALATFDEALVRAVKVFGPAGSVVAAVESNRAEVLSALGRFADASAGFRRALAIWRAAGGDAVTQAYAQTGLGLSLIGEGRPLEAVAPLEAAVATRAEKSAGAVHLGESRLALARALWARPSEHRRALDLARRARAALAGLETPSAKEAVAALDTWLGAPAAHL